MHKKIIVTVLALILLLSLCACSKPELHSCERLEVEVKGNGSKTLKLSFTGPDPETYPRSISDAEDMENPVYTIESSKTAKDGTLILKIKGLTAGSCSLSVLYMDGEDMYAMGSAMVTVDEDLKVSVDNVSLVGEERFESLGEGLPEGCQITKADDSVKLIHLPASDMPWELEEYSEETLEVDATGYSEDDQCYVIRVYAFAAGTGYVSMVNRGTEQRITVNFQVVNVVDGETQSLELVKTDSTLSVYSVKESEEYVERAEAAEEVMNDFASDVYVPEAAVLEGTSNSEGYLEISLKLGDNELEYLVFNDVDLEEELAAIKTEFPDAESDSFESNGVSVNLFFIDGYAMAVWEKGELVYELFILEAANITEAGNVVEAFLADTSL